MVKKKDKPPSHIPYRELLLLLLFSFLLALLVNVRPARWFLQYETGDIARTSVRSPYEFTLPGTDGVVKKGEIIVREGQRISAEDLQKLSLLNNLEKERRPMARQILFLFGIFFSAFAAMYQFAEHNIKKFRLSEKDLLFCLTLTLSTTILIKGCTLLFEYFAADYLPHLLYVIPFFFFGLIMRIVLFSEVALVFSAILAIAVAFMVENGISVFLYTFLGNILAAYFAERCEKRTTILKAGFFTAIIMAFVAFLLSVLNGHPLSSIPLKTAFILLSGIGSSFIALGLLPVIEYVFDYTTDIKLLELANLEHPVLEEMMVNAPGSYHHSIIVGNLSKAAAESIGAHPILTRVAAYYHDIGKLRMPHYFIENRQGSEDAHRSLSPNMSALIILSHVKEGVELAEKYKLGSKIVEMIQQHHGTRLVTYFYNRAKEIEDTKLYSIDEKDFRYPGPRPQTKEAGIVMLADAVEAASRTLEEPTPKRIETLVQNVVESIFVDGQLDDCELTLKDLHSIQKHFTSILIGIFHHRIEYPERIENVGAHKKFPNVVEGGQKTPKKDNRRLARLFRAAG